jgi:hypothetical protein
MKTPGLRIAAAVLFVCGGISPLAVAPLTAQQKKPPKPPPPPKAQGHPAGKPSAAAKRLNENPAKELDRFTNMSPKEREKELSQLPPQRRAAFEQRLARYQQMTPDQQEKFKQKLELMQSLPKDRQNAIRSEIERLQALPFAQRKKELNSEAFNQKFSPDEQTLVRDRFPNITKQDQPPPTGKD